MFKISSLRTIHIARNLRVNGYIVLVPEIGEIESESIKKDGLPEFNRFTIENCISSIAANSNVIKNTITESERKLLNKQDSAKDITNILKELDHNSNELETIWGIAKTLYLANDASIPTKSYLNIHDKARAAKASKFTNPTIFQALLRLKNNVEEYGLLDSEEKRLIEKYLLEGKLNGLNLSKRMKEQLTDCIVNLGHERTMFLNKVNHAVSSFSHPVKDYNLVREFPEHLLQSMAKNPNDVTAGPWKVTLHQPIYEEFLKYCPDRMQRWNVWQANVRKCSLQSQKSAENSTHLEKIRGFRQKQAEILGFSTYAEMSMQTKMVPNVDNVKHLFSDLLKNAGPKQVSEINNLQQFATKSGFEHSLDVFDISFWQRKQLLSEHGFDEEKFREYFPLENVLKGLFGLSELIFDIKIVQKQNADVWHENVKYYEVYDNAGNGFDPVGGFFLDCYSKEFNKINSGYMVGIRNIKPLSALIFNFNTPLYGKPYLLSISDLKMVFKSFGAQLQHLLTKARFNDLAGLSNIEWDASQLCGQVLTNFLDDPNVISRISSHCITNEPLEGNKLNNILLQKQHMSGYNLCNELYLANLDIELYNSKDFWLDVVKRLWPVYKVIQLDKNDAHVCSMTNIIAGDWSAAYFSHLYSAMLAADVYESFTDNKQDLSVIGKRFKETFLACGGTVSTPEVFRRFRGRDPSHEALLKNLDLFNSAPTVEEY